MADWKEKVRRKNADIDRRDAQYQRPPAAVDLGPLTTSILDGSAWEGRDTFRLIKPTPMRPKEFWLMH